MRKNDTLTIRITIYCNDASKLLLRTFTYNDDSFTNNKSRVLNHIEGVNIPTYLYMSWRQESVLKLILLSAKKNTIHFTSLLPGLYVLYSSSHWSVTCLVLRILCFFENFVCNEWVPVSWSIHIYGCTKYFYEVIWLLQISLSCVSSHLILCFVVSNLRFRSLCMSLVSHVSPDHITV